MAKLSAAVPSYEKAVSWPMVSVLMAGLAFGIGIAVLLSPHYVPYPVYMDKDPKTQ